ncbi:DUF4253 domain-containing protein [Actinomadura fulvescens]
MTTFQAPDGLRGRLVTPDSKYTWTGEPMTEPVLWISDDRLDGENAGRLWAELLPRHRETGLWPLLLGNETDGGYPWHVGAINPIPSSWGDKVNVDEWLARGWQRTFVECFEDQAPFDAWPGRAPSGESDSDPEQVAVELATTPSGIGDLIMGKHGPYLGLVPAHDGPDAIMASGWFSEGGVEEATAVVRTWQERFGVRLCSLAEATFSVTVAWPPRTLDHARHVAAEHYAFCHDLTQGYDFQEYAEGLVDAPVWSFWWD